jgi:hypothetical protein
MYYINVFPITVFINLYAHARTQVFGLIDLCYIFVIHTQQDVTKRNKILRNYLRRLIKNF